MNLVHENELVKIEKVRYWEMITHWFIILMLLVFPIFIDRYFYENITEAKFYALLCITPVYLLACLLVAAIVFLSKKKKEARFENGKQKLTVSQGLILVYFAIALISYAKSQYGWECLWGQSRYEGLISMFLYISLFFFISFWGEYSERFFYVMGIAAIIIGVIGVLQIFGSTLYYSSGQNYYSVHFLTTLGNIDCVSGMIAILVPVLFCSYIILEEKLRFVFPLGMFLLMFIQLFIDVDSGKMGLLAAFAIALPFLIDNKVKALRTVQMIGVLLLAFGCRKVITYTTTVEGATNMVIGLNTIVIASVTIGVIAIVLGTIFERKLIKRINAEEKEEGNEPSVGTKGRNATVEFKLGAKNIRKISYLVIGACIVIAFLFIFFYSGSNRLLFELHEASHLRLSDEAGSGRGIIYKNCIKIIAENPLLGTGPGTFAATYSPYNVGTIGFDFAHCDLLQIAVCQGLIGLAVYIAFLASIVVKALKNASVFPPIVIMGACLAGYLVHSFFSFSIAIVTPTFWIMAGILDKTVRQIPKDGKEATEEIEAKETAA